MAGFGERARAGSGEYRGASGLAMAFAGAPGTALWRNRPGLRTLLACLGIALAGKALADALGVAPGLSSLPGDVRVAWQAHVLGVILGALAVSARCADSAGPG